ncbi:NUDIX domain-containing protein [Bacillus cereus group sp. BfR-BA-01446]|uniref:NUDIX domain-containing protein n=1 Tax=Bacillus cereus group sp. BfR-BA-01446 TaxID=2920350 RepID=UPI001F569A97|nr:NUDIX domain-containing protein [Bacillus cereus group sp. BfR-BA-01446]
MKIQFHQIVRGVLIKDGKLLIAHFKGHHSFLPRGHIELGEAAEKALLREWEEEIGLACSIEKFLGVVKINGKMEIHYEINHIFKVQSNKLTPETPPGSRESHLEFYWITPSEKNLKRYNVMPDTAVQSLMKKMQENNIESYWVSTL